MIISFSGAQSTGKTTLLTYLQKLNSDKYEFVPEVTRFVRDQYNLPINEQGNDLTQYMIMAEHVKNIYKDRQHEQIILDRCALDGVVYSHWLSENGIISLGSYVSATSIYNKIIEKYDIIFYTDPGDVEIEDDGERSTDKKFRDDILSIFEQYMCGRQNIVTLKGTVEERLRTIKKTLAFHNLDIII